MNKMSASNIIIYAAQLDNKIKSIIVASENQEIKYLFEKSIRKICTQNDQDVISNEERINIHSAKIYV